MSDTIIKELINSVSFGKSGYICNISKKVIKMPFFVINGYALNKHTIIPNEDSRFNLNNAYYINMIETSNGIILGLAFDIEDVHKTKVMLANYFLTTKGLPEIIVEEIVSLWGCKKKKSSGYLYELIDFPFEFRTIITKKLNNILIKYLSPLAVKELYKLGLLKPCCCDQYHSDNIILMSDEKYDQKLGKNKENVLGLIFSTKNEMYSAIKQIDECIKVIF